jgi:hypothetical protein
MESMEDGAPPSGADSTSMVSPAKVSVAGTSSTSASPTVARSWASGYAAPRRMQSRRTMRRRRRAPRGRGEALEGAWTAYGARTRPRSCRIRPVCLPVKSSNLRTRTVFHEGEVCPRLHVARPRRLRVGARASSWFDDSSGRGLSRPSPRRDGKAGAARPRSRGGTSERCAPFGDAEVLLDPEPCTLEVSLERTLRARSDLRLGP